MHPELLNLGPLSIKTYGACMAAGFAICWWLIEKLSGRKDLGNLLVALMISGVVGSRIAYVIENWNSQFAGNPVQVLRIWEGGLVFYGGLILAIVTYFIWCRFAKLSALATADLLCAVLPLGHAFGRIGCFFYGCCYGKLSSSPLAVSFPVHSPAWYEQLHAGLITTDAKGSLPVLPTELFEAGALLALFAVVVTVYVKFSRGRTGIVAGTYLALYALIRFGLEYLRGDPRAAVGPLSIGQTISLGIFLAGAAFIAFAFTRREPPE